MKFNKDIIKESDTLCPYCEEQMVKGTEICPEEECGYIPAYECPNGDYHTLEETEE